MTRLSLGPQEQIAADQFRAFYAQLAAIRDELRMPLALPAADAPPTDAEHGPTPAPLGIETVRKRLADAITAYGYRPDDAAFGGGVDPGYVMAAVADEVLVVQCSGWRDQEAWIDTPLESVLYGSALAGDRIFTAAEELIAGDRDDPRTATIILLALLAGFRGRYQGRDDRGCIALFRSGLYTRVCNRAYQPADAAPYAATELGATTLTGESNRPLPALWPWLAALVLILLVYVPVSHAIWLLHTAATDRLAKTVIDNKTNKSRVP